MPRPRGWVPVLPACGRRIIPCLLVLVAAAAGAASLTSSTARASGVWERIAPLPTGHLALATATTLRDGRVLLVGGTGSNGSPTADSDLYDPTTGRWSVTSPLPVALSGHTATLLRDGRVLVAGGRSSDDRARADAELYDPTLRDPTTGRTGGWVRTAPMLRARAFHAAVELADGRVLVAGGCDTSCYAHSTAPDDPTTSVEIYDPRAVDASSRRAGAWTLLQPLQHGRYAHTATLLPDGRALVVGGLSQSAPDPDPPAEIVDIRGGGTVAAPEEPGGVHRFGHTATLLRTGQVLVIGGMSGGQHGAPNASAELYDPVGNSWKFTGILAHPRVSHTATLLPDGDVLVAGGYTGNGTSGLGEPSTGGELYDPDTGMFTTAGSMPGGHALHAAVLLTGPCDADCGVLIAGGITCTSCAPQQHDNGIAVDLFAASLPSKSSGRTVPVLPAAGAGAALIVAIAGAVGVIVRRRNAPW